MYYGLGSEPSKNKLIIDCKDNRQNILLKTIKCFEKCQTIKYDYILRLCACSYINIPKLKTFIDNIPDKKVFSGPLNYTSQNCDLKLGLNKEPFIVGANMLLSRDIVEFILENQEKLYYLKYGMKDDLAISMLINKYYLEKNKWKTQPWICLSTNPKIENLQKISSYHYHYNFRNYMDKLEDFHSDSKYFV